MNECRIGYDNAEILELTARFRFENFMHFIGLHAHYLVHPGLPPQCTYNAWKDLKLLWDCYPEFRHLMTKS